MPNRQVDNIREKSNVNLVVKKGYPTGADAKDGTMTVRFIPGTGLCIFVFYANRWKMVKLNDLNAKDETILQNLTVENITVNNTLKAPKESILPAIEAINSSLRSGKLSPNFKEVTVGNSVRLLDNDGRLQLNNASSDSSGNIQCSAAFFNVAGSDNVQLKNVGATLKVRNADDSADAIIKAKRLQVDTTVSGVVGAVLGEIQYNTSGVGAFFAHGRGLVVDAVTTGTGNASGNTSTLMCLSQHADGVLKFQDAASPRWSLGFDKHSGTTFTCGGTSDTVDGDQTITMDDTTPGSDTIAVGMLISGSGIPTGSVVTEITDGTHIEISEEATATANNITATFTPLDEKFKIDNGSSLDDISIFELNSDGVLAITATEGNAATLSLRGDDSDDNGDDWNIGSSNGLLKITNDISGSQVVHLSITANATVAHSFVNVIGNIAVPAARKISCSGAAGDTYIYENSADNLRIVVGGDTLLEFNESGTNGNSVAFSTSCAGFTQLEPTEDATDTEVDFRHSNKQKLTVTGNITDIHFQFPAISGNFLCVILQDGDNNTISNWKTKDSAGNAGAGNSGLVLWAGGTAPANTESDTKADIASFYWDADNEIAYGTYTYNF